MTERAIEQYLDIKVSISVSISIKIYLSNLNIQYLFRPYLFPTSHWRCRTLLPHRWVLRCSCDVVLLPPRSFQSFLQGWALPHRTKTLQYNECTIKFHVVLAKLGSLPSLSVGIQLFISCHWLFLCLRTSGDQE